MRISLQLEVKRDSQRGSTLLELMIAMLVLAIGLGAVTTLLTVAIASNDRNSRDTTGTLLAQMVIEQISAQNVYSDHNVGTTDCAGTVHQFSTTPGAVGTGAGATLKADGTIDFTQPVAALIASGYAMQYVDCSAAGGVTATYDVRWNVMAVSTNTSTRMITAAARSAGNQLGGFHFVVPVNLRGIGGPTIGE
jgi:type IV pilus modification protein PilV